MFRAFVPTVSCVLALTACVKTDRKKEESPALPDKPVSVVEAQKNPGTLLDLKVDVQDNGLKLNIGKVPAGSTLECTLTTAKINPCHDGAIIQLPAAGEYKLTVHAFKDGAEVAFGESSPFVIMPAQTGSTPVGTPTDLKDELALELDDPNFKLGMAVPMTQGLVVKFKLRNAPTCAVKMRCLYDSQKSEFWTECDEGSQTYTVSKAIMALGEQYLSVQAVCADKGVGPTLKVYWAGVPDGYADLMLHHWQDGLGRHLLDLVRPDDCPSATDRKMMCGPEGAEFDACKNSNILDNPPKGLRVRMDCKDRKGPVLTLP